MKWDEIVKGDWVYNSTTGKLARIVDVTGIGPNIITVVPLADISKRIIVNQETYERHSFHRALFQVDSQGYFFNVIGHGRVEAPAFLKNLKQGDALPKELHVVEYKTPMAPLGSRTSYNQQRDSHVADAVRYSTGIDMATVQNINPHMACKHEWIPTKLFFSTVYDCKKCGKKKENA